MYIFLRRLAKIEIFGVQFGRAPSRCGKGPGYPLQSFFAGGPKKKDFRCYPSRFWRKSFLLIYTLKIWSSKISSILKKVYG